MALTNYPIDSALEAAEREFEIDIVNKITGAIYAKAPVYAENTIGQIIKEYGSEIGVNPDEHKIIFINKRTGESTSDPNITVNGLGLQEGDVLCVNDDGIVAGDEDVFEIDLTHKITGAMYAKAPVYAENTLGQIIKEYGSEIGVNPDDPKIIFINKRTGDSTSDFDETAGGLGLQDGDVLCVNDDGAVAGVI